MPYIYKYIWEKSLPDCSQIVPNQAFFYITQRGITPETQVYQWEHMRSWSLLFKHFQTLTRFIVKSVASIATDLTINYANFAPLNVFNIAALRVFIMLS